MKFKGSYYDSISSLALLTFILAAWFSAGYHHPDEHFQIIEFANYKLGQISSDQLPWEFNEQIRPGLPVFIAWGVFKIFGFIGITNPYFLVFVLRLMVAVPAWMILRKLGLKLLPNFKTEAGKKIFFAMIFFVWFVPYTSVRFSSENLSAVTFLAAILLLLTVREMGRGPRSAKMIIAGLLLGFAFYFRFQLAFAIIGLFTWMIFIDRVRWRHLMLLFTGGGVALFFCMLIDYWFYGTWVLTPENYFTTNIVQGVAADFGVTPWWNYFYLYTIQVIPPLSIVLLLFFFYGSIKNPRSFFLWCIVPFLVVHFMVGHKETRFLFPVIFAFLYLAAVGIDAFIQSGKLQRVGRVVLILILIINTPLLIYRSFSPARESLSYYEFLDDLAGDRELTLYSIGNDPYIDANLPVSFYRSPEITSVVLPDREHFMQHLAKVQPKRLYLLEYGPMTDDQYEGYSSKILYKILPDWVLNININNWVSRTKIWKVKELVRN